MRFEVTRGGEPVEYTSGDYLSESGDYIVIPVIDNLDYESYYRINKPLFRFRIVNFDIGRQHFYIGLNPFFDLGIVTQPYNLDDLVKRHTHGLYQTLAESFDANHDPDEQFSDYFTTEPKDIYRPHMTFGVGLKIGMNENFVLSADWGMPIDRQDNNKLANFYVKMGYLF